MIRTRRLPYDGFADEPKFHWSVQQVHYKSPLKGVPASSNRQPYDADKPEIFGAMLLIALVVGLVSVAVITPFFHS